MSVSLHQLAEGSIVQVRRHARVRFIRILQITSVMVMYHFPRENVDEEYISKSVSFEAFLKRGRAVLLDRLPPEDEEL